MKCWPSCRRKPHSMRTIHDVIPGLPRNPAKINFPRSGQNRHCPALRDSLNQLDSRLRGNDEV